MAHFTKIYHQASYSAISSENPLNSQSGRTVVIAGASSGIGNSIAQSFAKAAAARIILLGRTASTLTAAAAALPHAEARVCDISSESDIQQLWNSLGDEGIHVDVLVLNAALIIPGSLTSDIKAIWSSFETTVLGNLRMAQLFVAQMGEGTGHALINISSFMAHSNPAPAQGSYSASKAAFASLLQHLAEEIPASKATIVNVHPGAIFTEAADAYGLTRESLPWDDDNLPGDYSVWASTPAASFLHGRFLWANWDVQELIQRKAEIEADEGLLKIGVQGVEHVDIRSIFTKVPQRKL
ncbi:short-chain dehydrogenase/reductase [Microdochium bolleyi]|uniref:Short-chain dehydrogenase/reductase n=1 Tax=Microdochium bolleyi TaxID=196109 RepID=A0A136IQL6_9PEZI|nr:short-chain dehydrogenase/reductase [Microdochium bolleyi]